MIEVCDCSACTDSKDPCHFDCHTESECEGCREAREASQDREFDEKVALGYL